MLCGWAWGVPIHAAPLPPYPHGGGREQRHQPVKGRQLGSVKVLGTQLCLTL